MAHTRFGFHWNWDGKECVLQSRCTDELGTVQPTRAEVAKFFNVPLDELHVAEAPTIPFNRGGWPAMGAFTMRLLRLLLLVMILGVCRMAGHSRPPMVWEGPRPQKKSVPGISRSVLRERNSRRGAEPPRKARSSFGRRGARDATGQQGSEPELRRW